MALTRLLHSLSFKQKQSINEDIVASSISIVWLDVCNVTQSNEFSGRRARFRRLVDYMETFDDVDRCIEYCVALPSSNRLFIVMSGSIGQQLVPRIVKAKECKITCSILGIYIFCQDIVKHKIWADQYPLIQGIFSDKQEVVNHLNDDVLSVVELDSSPPMSFFFPPTVTADQKEKSSRNLDGENASFIWFQLFVETLLRMGRSPSAKRDMIDESRRLNAGNIKALRVIDEFESQYKASDAIQWYTKDTFVYRVINEAFRTEDIDRIFRFRYFIADLYHQLTNLHQMELNTIEEQIQITYRGQKMHKREFDGIKSNIGGRISMNTFLSTTKDRAVAKVFAGESVGRHYVSVLFEFHLDMRLRTQPFATISAFSAMPEEEELLYAYGAIFRIESVEHIKQGGLWIVKLISVEENDPSIVEVMEYFKLEIEWRTGLLALGELLLRIGDIQRAERYYYMLQSQIASDDPRLGLVHSGLGDLCLYRNQLEEARKHYRLSQDADERNILDREQRSHANEYNRIGTTYQCEGNYQRALFYHQRALEELTRYPPDNPLLLASTYYNMGLCYRNNHNQNKQALDFFQKALEVLKDSYIPEHHPDVGVLHKTIGTLLYDRGRCKEALTHLQQALEIQNTFLPTTIFRQPCLPKKPKWEGPLYKSETGVPSYPTTLSIGIAGIDSIGLDGTGIDSIGLDGTGIDSIGLDGTGIDSIGLDGTGIDSIGLDGTGIDSIGLDGTGIDWH